MNQVAEKIAKEISALPLGQQQILRDRITRDVDQNIKEESLRRANEIDDGTVELKSLDHLQNSMRKLCDELGLNHPPSLKQK